MEVNALTPRATLQRAELDQIEVLAKQIRNTRQLRAILGTADPKMREGVYDLICPLLNFTPPAYTKLMRAKLKKGK